MEFAALLSFLHASAFLLAAFGLSLGFAMAKGRQNLINLMMGAYLGLLLYQLFPWREAIAMKTAGEKAEALAFLAIFAFLTLLSAWLFARLMPREFLEGAFETMGKKLLLALGAMILALTLSIHYLPVGELINTGTPLPSALLSDQLAFLWLLAPLAILFAI